LIMHSCSSRPEPCLDMLLDIGENHIDNMRKGRSSTA
jgi:hypothetical protein